MKNIQNLTIDINKKPFQTITANKGEVGSRFIKINIVDNSTPVDLTGVTISLYAKKPDGKKVFNSVTIEDKTNGVVLAELTSQILSVVGIVRLTLLLVKDGSKLASKQFLVNVDESIVDDEAIESTNEFTALVDALGRVNNIDSRFEEVDSQLEHNMNEINEQFNAIKNISAIANRTKLEFINLLNGQEDWQKSCWLTPNQEQGDWVFTDDTMKPTFTELNTHGVNIFNKSKLIQDGEIGVTIKGFDINSTDNNAVAINFKGKNKSDYFSCLLFFNFKQIWIGKTVDGSFTRAKSISYDDSQIVPKNGEAINISVRFVGTRFSVYMNGSALFDEDVSSYFTLRESIGLFGFGIYNGSTKLDTWTKNIVFENPWVKEFKFNEFSNEIGKILHVGDSLTYGAGVTTDERWTTLLYNKLKALNKDIESDNVAVSGSTMDVVLSQVVSNILKGYDLVTILGGTNNSRIDDVGTTIDTAIDQLRQAIWQCKGNGSIPIVCTCPPIDRTKNSSAVNSQSWAWIVEYNNKVRRLCSKEKIICIDFFNSFKNDLSLLQSDKIHPTSEGHILMYETVYNSIFCVRV